MTAPDDLARLIAAHREVKPWVCLCGWWSAIQEPDDYPRHLASVVSRRDADLQARLEVAWKQGDLWTTRILQLRQALDSIVRLAENGSREMIAEVALDALKLPDARSRRPADTDTGRGQ